MARSMTGFGAASSQNAEAVVRVELRSVNHRHLDLRIHAPANSAPLPEVSKLVQSRLARGRVDLRLEIAATDASAGPQVRIDHQRARAIAEATDGLLEALGRAQTTPAEFILSAPGVLAFVETPLAEDSLAELAQEAVTQALDELVRMREVEGAHLSAQIKGHLDTVRALAAQVEKRSPVVMQQRVQRLRDRLQDFLQSEVDEQRLAHEVAILADKLDTTEELERLESHLKQAEQLLDGSEPAGRRLDFIVQEMNREANTIGSKCQDADVVHLVVDLKAEIERMREQAQNLE